MNPHDELRTLLELVPSARSGGHDTRLPSVPAPRSTFATYDGGHLDDLRALAESATRVHDVDDAWAGRRDPYDTRITCALCGHEQPITIPFLNVTCRGCASAVLPARCGTCHHISVVFSPEQRLSTTAPCACGAGVLRPLLRLPAARTTPVEQVLGVVGGAGTPLAHRLGRGARTAILCAGLIAILLCGLVLRAQVAGDSPRPEAPPVTVVQPVSDAPDDLGRAAAQNLVSAGRPVNVFACRAAAPDSLAPPAEEATTPGLEAFLEACAAE